MCLITCSLFLTKYFHKRLTCIPFFNHLSLWQYLALENCLHKELKDLNLYHCLYWKAMQTSDWFLTLMAPLSYGKPKVSNETQWYFSLSCSHPQKKSEITPLMYLRVVLGGDTTAKAWMGIDRNTGLVRVILPPKLKILPCHFGGLKIYCTHFH